MAKWYLLLPGTRVQVSNDGGPFIPLVLKTQLCFKSPMAITLTNMYFAAGNQRILAKRCDVLLSDGDERSESASISA